MPTSTGGRSKTPVRALRFVAAFGRRQARKVALSMAALAVTLCLTALADPFTSLLSRMSDGWFERRPTPAPTTQVETPKASPSWRFLMSGSACVANVTAGDTDYTSERDGKVGDTMKAQFSIENREINEPLRGLTMNWWVGYPSAGTAFVHVRWSAVGFRQVDSVATITSDRPFRLLMQSPDGILKSPSVDGKYPEQYVDMGTGRVEAPTLLGRPDRNALSYSVLLKMTPYGAAGPS